MRMTTCREPNGFITQVQILISKGRSYSFRRDSHLSYRKESSSAIFDCEQRLVVGFIWDFERIVISNLPSVSSCIQEGRFAMVNHISATLRRVPVIRFRYERPDQRGFSFCYATIESLKQFALRNSLKRDGRGPSEQFRLTTKLTNVVGISFIFVTSFGRYPCPGGNAFSSTTFPSTDCGFWQSDHHDL